MMIHKNKIVKIKREFQDAGDDQFVRVAIEDEDGGRVLIVALCGLPINPTEIIPTYMLEQNESV